MRRTARTQVLFFDRNTSLGPATPEPRPYINVITMRNDTANVQYQWRRARTRRAARRASARCGSRSATTASSRRSTRFPSRSYTKVLLRLDGARAGGVLLLVLVGVRDVLRMQHLGVAQLLGNPEPVDEQLGVRAADCGSVR